MSTQMRARVLPRLTTLTTALLSAGCLDFADPVFPEAGAAAVISATVVLEEGEASVSGQLSPGFDIVGFRREVPNDSLLVQAHRVGPRSVSETGARGYNQDLPFSGTAGPIEVVAPVIEGIIAPTPSYRWYGMERVGNDTVHAVLGEAVTLNINTGLGVDMPTPDRAQWFLTLNGARGTFRLGGDDEPPGRIFIAPEYLPVSEPGTVRATLIYQKSRRFSQPPNDYIGNLALDTRLVWIIVLTAPPAAP